MWTPSVSTSIVLIIEVFFIKGLELKYIDVYPKNVYMYKQHLLIPQSNLTASYSTGIPTPSVLLLQLS